MEIKKPLPAPVHSVSQIRFKFRSQFYLLPWIICLITLRTERSIIIIDSNITGNIIRKNINLYYDKYCTNNDALKNSSINWIFLRKLPIQDHLKLSITEKRQTKAKYLNRKFIRLKFVKNTSVPNPVKSLGY